MGVCIGLVRGVIAGPEYIAVAILKGSLLGALLSVILGGLEQIALRRLWRRLSILQAILVRTAIYAPLATVVYLTVSAVLSPWLPWSLQRQMILPSLGVAVAGLFIGSAVLALIRLLGTRVLRNLLSGRYRRPFEEQRIFLFIDLVGSTTMAEKIGHLRYHSFLRDFIEDLEEPVLAYGGDVYQYVGDEVVVTWLMADPQSNSRCLSCHFAIVDAIERVRSRYERAYGAAPSFRSGIHCGRVVAGEIGDQRKQIVFVGDVVNTASRAEAEAKAQGKGLVVTGTLLTQSELPQDIEAKSLGTLRLKGKEEAIDLYEVVRSGSELHSHSTPTSDPSLKGTAQSVLPGP
ncbi:MAG: adenylate/guanylate cyclase domain-containing protein [Burkholderiaceae bacterium]